MNRILNRTFVVKFKDISKWVIPNNAFINITPPKGWRLLKVRTFATQVLEKEIVKPNSEYKLVGVKWYGEGTFHRETVLGKDISARILTPLVKNAFLYNRLFAWKASFAIVPEEHTGFFVSNEFPQFVIDKKIILVRYFYLVITQKIFVDAVKRASQGSAAVSRNRFVEEDFLELMIPVPPIEMQKKIINTWKRAQAQMFIQDKKNKDLKRKIHEVIFSNLEIFDAPINKTKYFAGFFKDLDKWSYQNIILTQNLKSEKYPLVCLGQLENSYSLLTRGKSPRYDPESESIILNQKCNRWNKIDLSFAKKVSNNWLSKVDEKLLTRANDVIINSTGEGTLGRATCIDSQHQRLFYDSHILNLRLDQKLLNSSYFAEIFNTSFIQKQIEVNKSAQSTKQTELGIQNLLRIQFPLPTLNRQIELVNKINKMRVLIKTGQKNRDFIDEQYRKEIELIVLGKKRVV